jgi:hypothetical protein
MRVIVLVSACLLAACATSHRRPPLAEVPIGTTPPPDDGRDPVAVRVKRRTPTAVAPVPRRTGSVYARASELLERGDTAGARLLLQGRVFGRGGTPAEARLLRGICKKQHDDACLDRIPAR